MPELPEVETVVRDLRPLLSGRRITFVRRGSQNLRRPWRSQWESLLVDCEIAAVRRRGKWIVLDLGNNRTLLIHLGMTGQLTVMDSVAPLSTHTHLVLGLEPNDTALAVPRELRFRDVRRFGSVTYFESSEQLSRFFDHAGLGPEPSELDSKVWRQSLAATRRCLKAVLLDQRVVAGVGNIYADESLFQARLHPNLSANSLNAVQATRLRKGIVAVLARAIEHRGSTIRDYIGGSGLKGNFQEEFCVYGRTGKPCVRCRKPIACIRLAGRSTHYCPRCQKEVISGLITDY